MLPKAHLDIQRKIKIVYTRFGELKLSHFSNVLRCTDGISPQEDFPLTWGGEKPGTSLRLSRVLPVCQAQEPAIQDLCLPPRPFQSLKRSVLEPVVSSRALKSHYSWNGKPAGIIFKHNFQLWLKQLDNVYTNWTGLPLECLWTECEITHWSHKSKEELTEVTIYPDNRKVNVSPRFEHRLLKPDQARSSC